MWRVRNTVNEGVEMESGPPPNYLCSICHANFHILCQANFSHWFLWYQNPFLRFRFSPFNLSSINLQIFHFAANCIMLVWKHASGTSSCKCPLSRRPITLLIPTQHSLS
ncbi:hypothetical protein V8G54_014343 [Vigna mungo]|uniref:Uncharacterized protein n=1 Tax=Vigna mungo TaxID=3915 RepID=A0AAQ3RYH9_VIGMU